MADWAMLDAIDLDEWREAAALQNEISAKLADGCSVTQ
jgi:hypothetical protein